MLSALPMERQLCAGNRDDLGNLQGAGMWQPRDPRSAPAGASPLRPSQHCCRYGPRQHCSFHRPPAAPCLLFSMHEGYASRQTAPFVGCALQMPNGSPDHTASSLWLRPRSVSPAIPFASNAASHSSGGAAAPNSHLGAQIWSRCTDRRRRTARTAHGAHRCTGTGRAQSVDRKHSWSPPRTLEP